jgi:outer membrane receptor protein involved in Fe transport
MRWISYRLGVLFGLLSACVTIVQAQEVAMADRAPRFLVRAASGAVPVDADRAPVLRRRLSLDLRDVPLGEALATIARESGLRLGYSSKVVPVQRTVRLVAEDITLGGALSSVLFDVGVDVLFERDGQAAIVPRMPVTVQPPVGTVVGRVTDAKSGAGLAGATVVIEGTSRSGTTGNDGRYRIAEVPPGTYTVRARYIGYAPATVSVTVSADQEATADLALGKSAQRLDEVVTTGTVVPTEVKALPTPVSVISDSEIALQRPHTVQELFRQLVPTAVSWDMPQLPVQTAFAVRGASTFSAGTGQLKVFVDGIEVASPTLAGVDPASIERIEVVRGPQAAAIYGSDAIGGVMQIFTKRGDPTKTRPQIDAEAALGVIQTPYAGFGGVLRQGYKGSAYGGGSDVSYNVGAGYSHTADWLPNGELSAQSSPSIYGGMHFAKGILDVDMSGRYYTQNDPIVLNPLLSQTGFVPFAKPNYQPSQYQSQTFGARVSAVPNKWWRNTLTVGLDHLTQDVAQTRPRLTTPDDTLLTVDNQSRTKASIGFNSSLQGALGSGLSGSLTLGFDHWSLPISEFSTDGALSTSGTIKLAPGAAIDASRTITNNTGYFAQVQLGFRDALFLTGGLRAEQNTNFGDSLGTPLSPRAGLSYAQPLGQAIVKLRGSYGRAIRAAAPGLALGDLSASSVTLPNPSLGPERQQGWDAGVDVVFADRGSISLSYFDQTADNLIQRVLVAATPILTFQNQNVGRVKNTGVEIEGTLSAGPIAVRAQYGYTRSRVAQLPANYSGDLRLGDQSLLTPKHTAGGAVVFSPLRGTSVAAGLSYVGSWTYYDVLTEVSCFGGTGSCQPGPGFRGYLISYPSIVKLNLNVSQQITPLIAGFVSVDNLTNSYAYELYNTNPVMGRITTAGVRVHL